MRKIRLFSRSISGENAVEAAMTEALDKWQKEHPKCRITAHNMAFITVGTPRLFLSVEYDDGEDATA